MMDRCLSFLASFNASILIVGGNMTRRWTAGPPWQRHTLYWDKELDSRPRPKEAALAYGLGYVVPNPLESFEDWQKFTCQDLAVMGALELALEKKRVEIALAFADGNDRLWLQKRLKEITKEERRRR